VLCEYSVFNEVTKDVDINVLDMTKLEYDLYLNLVSTIYATIIYYPDISIKTIINCIPFNTFINWTNDVLREESRYSVFLGKVIYDY